MVDDLIEAHPSDVVSTPPGEEHWHGAAPDHFMVHLALCECDLLSEPGGLSVGAPAHDLPQKSVTYYYIALWRDDGTDQAVHDLLRCQVRQQAGLAGPRARPRSSWIPRRSAPRTTSRPRRPTATTSRDTGKKVPGRKPGLAVDALGPIIAVVMTAASVTDNVIGVRLLEMVEAVGGGADQRHDDAAPPPGPRVREPTGVVGVGHPLGLGSQPHPTVDRHQHPILAGPRSQRPRGRADRHGCARLPVGLPACCAACACLCGHSPQQAGELRDQLVAMHILSTRHYQRDTDEVRWQPGSPPPSRMSSVLSLQHSCAAVNAAAHTAPG
ncbi:hypothetical protein [Streptomyces ipomoeae]|jgi:hypothetical protein|uniref:hypothetical protein n=1 Tax=Streptomyces ipomoeae TaxID=103232 RepID=UPI00215C060D|nr:hypothetical protein [Streptomyces ipomoeae]MDX2697068.1 hypothetical protein [Streptomyces ipomoeae]MDX2840200.1 hypothetical protein [Streptomyces ipomoeae]MDX2873575.1 hypothetical protein [Streptomyces ipomoeae]